MERRSHATRGDDAVILDSGLPVSFALYATTLALAAAALRSCVSCQGRPTALLEERPPPPSSLCRERIVRGDVGNLSGRRVRSLFWGRVARIAVIWAALGAVTGGAMLLFVPVSRDALTGSVVGTAVGASIGAILGALLEAVHG